jgi:hypothetical protein
MFILLQFGFSLFLKVILYKQGGECLSLSTGRGVQAREVLPKIWNNDSVPFLVD